MATHLQYFVKSSTYSSITFMQFDKSSHNYQEKIYCALLNSRSTLLPLISITVVLCNLINLHIISRKNILCFAKLKKYLVTMDINYCSFHDNMFANIITYFMAHSLMSCKEYLMNRHEILRECGYGPLLYLDKHNDCGYWSIWFQ